MAVSPRTISRLATGWVGVLVMAAFVADGRAAENWPRWRGPNGAAVSADKPLPVVWSDRQSIVWRTKLPGEGSSSPIVWNNRLFITSAVDAGARRQTHCLDVESGEILWTRRLDDDNAEVTSSLTGHAASTPATDGRHVVVFFGNAGAACYDFAGELLWRRDFGEFESELGLASSPVIDQGRVFLVCDHDGAPPASFHSFLIALDVASGETVWRTDRPGLFRSWSTPVLAPGVDNRRELVVNAQDELRGYSREGGELVWRVTGMAGWVTPSPLVVGDCGNGVESLILAASGRDGPTLAVRTGGRGDVTGSHVVWRDENSGPYVCSPLYYNGLLYVHNELGVLTCRQASTGKIHYRRRLGGKFIASAVAGDGKLYLGAEDGLWRVVQAGPEFVELATNRVDGPCLASPAIYDRRLFIRGGDTLYCIGEADSQR